MALQAMTADIRSAVAHGKFRMVSLDAQDELGRDTDTIDFILSRPNPTRKKKNEGGRAEVGYSIGALPDGESRWLLRREDRTLDDDPLEGGAAALAGSHVTELNLDFYDGKEWQAGWTSSESFPQAVRIHVVVVDEDDTEKPMRFTTTVAVMAR